MALISRDLFAREELHREAIPYDETWIIAHGCDWCGGFNGYGGLFKYWIEPDSVVYRRVDIYGLFCSVGCMRSYSHYS